MQDRLDHHANRYAGLLCLIISDGIPLPDRDAIAVNIPSALPQSSLVTNGSSTTRQTSFLPSPADLSTIWRPPGQLHLSHHSKCASSAISIRPLERYLYTHVLSLGAHKGFESRSRHPAGLKLPSVNHALSATRV